MQKKCSKQKNFRLTFCSFKILFTFAAHFQAKVAQLVEHHLAKVGVASSNLVFRSQQSPLTKEGLLFKKEFARVVELVDTQDLKSCFR